MNQFLDLVHLEANSCTERQDLHNGCAERWDAVTQAQQRETEITAASENGHELAGGRSQNSEGLCDRA